MIKTIKIDNKEIQLDNNIGWTMIYRDQFETDIIPSIMPLFSSGFDIISGIIKRTGKTSDIEITDILESADGGDLVDAFIHLSGFEFVDFLHIVWSLAKNADDTLPDPKTWIRQFDNFPLDNIAPEVVKLVLTGVISSKNLKRLNGMIEGVRPKTKKSTSKLSSSPDLSEA